MRAGMAIAVEAETPRRAPGRESPAALGARHSTVRASRQIPQVVEDHPLFCEALIMTLNQGLDEPRVTTAPNLALAVETLGQGQTPDLVILDLNLPDVAGLEGLSQIKAAAPSTPVLVVSSLNDPRIVARIMANGAAGFVPKDSNREAIVEAIRVIMDGKVHVPEGFDLQNYADDETDEEQRYIERLSDLTAQQGRILEAICEGKLNKQIAYDHSIAEATVKAHITAILRKLGVQNRTQAVLVAQKAKFASILHEDQIKG